MNETLLYHGATEQVSQPLVQFGRANLDFGQGFYLTDTFEQAAEWAKRQGIRRNLQPCVNTYLFDKEQVISKFRCKVFEAYDAEWFHFIVASRQGEQPWAQYDYIEGGVANDRVIDTINLYMLGLLTEEIALARLSEHKPNNQICILNQAIIDDYLVFQEVKPVK